MISYVHSAAIKYQVLPARAIATLYEAVVPVIFAKRFVAVDVAVTPEPGFHETVFVAALFHEPVAVPMRMSCAGGFSATGEGVSIVADGRLGVPLTVLIVSRISPRSVSPTKYLLCAIGQYSLNWRMLTMSK